MLRIGYQEILGRRKEKIRIRSNCHRIGQKERRQTTSTSKTKRSKKGTSLNVIKKKSAYAINWPEADIISKDLIRFCMAGFQ